MTNKAHQISNSIKITQEESKNEANMDVDEDGLYEVNKQLFDVLHTSGKFKYIRNTKQFPNDAFLEHINSKTNLTQKSANGKFKLCSKFKSHQYIQIHKFLKIFLFV